jgi:predicted nucleic acid-binding protein
VTEPPVVCDASVALAWLRDEPAPGWTVRFWSHVRDASIDVWVPTLFWIEVANALVRSRTLPEEQVLEGLIRLEGLAFRSVEMERPLRLMAIRLARRFRLTAYDALYLALAESMDAPLATLDDGLGAAASTLGNRYGEDGAPRVGEGPAEYVSDREPDPMSLAALGAYLARLRDEVTSDA